MATNVQPTQSFYALSLQHATAPVDAVLCSVIPNLSANDQQIFEARGTRVYLRQIVRKSKDGSKEASYSVDLLLEHDTFSIVRGVASLRVDGYKLDHLIISSDSGRMSICEYDAVNRRLVQVQLQTYGKSAIRRTVPGQYLAADPDGRCFMMASTEKNKLVYLLNRQPNGGNPVFAALEVDYAEIEDDDSWRTYERREKVLSYYTVDLGLNHVIKSWSDVVDYTSNKLFPVPGGSKGPSGMIVCAKGRLYYKHDKFESLGVQIPRRDGLMQDTDRDRVIVSGTLIEFPKNRGFCHLLQTDDGDVFKLIMQFDHDSWEPIGLEIKYFDTLPLATFLLSLKRGFLYVGAECGPTKVYRIGSMAESEHEEPGNCFRSFSGAEDHKTEIDPVMFRHRGLRHLLDTGATVPGLHPLIRTRVENILGEDSPQILALQGTGNESVLKLIKHGNPVEIFAQQTLGEVPWDGIWTIPHSRDNSLTNMLIVSSRYGEKTEVLIVDGNTVHSIDDSGFEKKQSTLLAANMREATRVQVQYRAITSIFPDGTTRKWATPVHSTISCAAANTNQMLVGLSTGEMRFFFMEPAVLNVSEQVIEMTSAITAIGLANTPPGRDQAKYGVVGCSDLTVRVMSIQLDNPMEVYSIQAVTAVPVSIVVTEMLDPLSNTNVTVVHIGLESGVYLRAIIDEVTGELSQTRSRFLGNKAVRICAAVLAGQQCVVLCSTKNWIAYHHPVTKQYTVTPLDTMGLDSITPFISDAGHGSLCGCIGTELLFFGTESLGHRLVTEEIKLQFTPRNLARHPTEGIVYVIESDGNTVSKPYEENMTGSLALDKVCEEDAVLGNPRSEDHWASCTQVVDLASKDKQVLNTYHLGLDFENEAALCCAVVAFESKTWNLYYMVGTIRYTSPPLFETSEPSRVQGGFVHTYRIIDDGKQLKWLHKTEFDKPIYAMAPYKGMMALGVGNMINIYDLGRAHVLRKCIGYSVPNTIVSLETMGNRIVCADVSESITYVVYNEEHNRLIPFVDDSVPRWTTAIGILDYDTTAGGDKFGNIWVMRCPKDVSREADEASLGGYMMNERSYMGGTPYRLENRAHFFCQDIPMSIQRTSLVPGGEEVVFWSGIQGTMGMLIPFVAHRDVKLFAQIEIQMRQHDPSISGRDHLAYRSYYSPVRSVIDGDLIERFLLLPYDKKQRIAADCERDIAEIEKKIQDMRVRVAF